MDNPLMEMDRIAQPILDLSAFGPPPSAMVVCQGGGKGKTTIGTPTARAAETVLAGFVAA